LGKILKVCETVSQEKDWMGRRDAAIISTLPLFGSRAKENAVLRRNEVEIGAGVVFVTFSILKLHHTKRVRCQCQRVVKFGWKHCPHCGESLKGIEPLPQKADQTDIKRQRKTDHPLMPFFLRWVEEVPLNGVLFPKSTLPGVFGIDTRPQWDIPLSRQGIYKVVRNHLSDYWPHLFRHNLATGFSSVGFSEGDLMKWFGWTRYETAERYTRLGGGARIKSMGESSV
jgi:integrase